MMGKGKMQVINDRKFIFCASTLKFGCLYKSAYDADGFLNTFTPCIFRESALQFVIYNAKVWAPVEIAPGFPGMGKDLL